MIIEKNKHRFTFIFIFIIFVASIFLFRLAQLQIVKGEEYREIAKNKMLQRIVIPSERGTIYTNDGYALSSNRIGYSVQMVYKQMEEKKRNKLIYNLSKILDKYEEDYEEEFPIIISENNQLEFIYKIEEQEWKTKHSIPKNATARETIDILRKRYHVKKSVPDKLAIEAITKVHLNENIPIKIDKTPEFIYKKSEIDWKKWYGFKKEEYGLSARESFNKLRKSYEIEEEYSIKDSRKILMIREKIKKQGFRSWESIEIANDVKKETMAEIVAQSDEMPGVVVNPEPIRNYPGGKLAAHVLGYISKVNEKDVAERGYKMKDLKGAQGLEAAYESFLKGEDGESLVVTDHRGRPTGDFKNQVKEPVSGNNLFLTIDYDLQKTAESALENTIKQMQTGEKGRLAKNAKSGAVVAIDVNTGAVLALASYPSFDPNLFAKGISKEDWEKYNVLTNDPIFPKPLYNNATMAALPPGSIFKMVVGVAGLEEKKIRIQDYVYDGGRYPGFGGDRFRCWLRSGHGNENITQAIRDSCNVYFYEVGNRSGIDNIEKYARAFGLGEKTGIEISESPGIMSSKAAKERSWMYTTSNYLRNTVGVMGNETIKNEKGEEQEVYKAYAIAKEIFDQISEIKGTGYNEIYNKVAEILKKNNVNDSEYIYKIYQYVVAGRWTVADTLNTSIGQGGTSLTPLQMANYVATIANGGTHYEPYLVEKIIDPNGKVVQERKPKVENKMNLDPKNVAAIKEGMRLVTAPGGTAGSNFYGYPHDTVGIAGKTGSAQYKEGSEAMSWFVGFAPFDKPQIAVAALVIQGEHGGWSAPIAREIIEEYLNIGEDKEKTDSKSIDNQIYE